MAGVTGVIAVLVLVHAVQIGRPAAILQGLPYAILAAFIARGAMNGVIVEPWGVKARTTFRTYRWRWDEIERFELREKGETPRFRVHLRNGRARGFLGFYARTAAEEEKSQALFKALEERLETEQAVGGRDMDG
jgi:hypothetical protein